MIISCSRRTDIPAFYSDWFFNRLHEGYVSVSNPVNARQVRHIPLAPQNVDCIVFWTKNPAPMLDRLFLLKDYHYYFQFTLTPYNKDIEPRLPPKIQLLDTFMKLSGKIGPQRVIWRYDPILLSRNINIDYHLEHFAALARHLSGYTKKCMISFLDMYRHLQRKPKPAGFSIRPPTETEMEVVAEKIARIAGNEQIIVETCAEKIDSPSRGIAHGRCIDDRLISALTGRRLKAAKDKNQRALCGCITSIDIGTYNTCRHLCIYCYANTNSGKMTRSKSRHNTETALLPSNISEIYGGN